MNMRYIAIGIIACAFLVVGATIGAMFSAKPIITDIAKTPATAAAILAAMLAFLSGVLGPFVHFIIGEKQAAASQASAEAALLTARTAGNREIARLRMEWMHTLRNTLSEYHAILMTWEDDKELDGPGHRELAKLGTQIDLLLNKDDELQGRLWQIADRIYGLEKQEERSKWDEALMNAGREVLKGEWEKVKREMKGSEFQTGERPSRRSEWLPT